MGGNAFAAILGTSAAFPRMPPSVYRALKEELSAKLHVLYEHVGTPREAPEKLDHGDIDFQVTEPREVYGQSVPHEVVKQTIGARYAIAMHENRTSNYAVPIQPDLWKTWCKQVRDTDGRAVADNGAEIYYQVDVHVCADKVEFDRLQFYKSYGDLGMILGVVFRNFGLAIGEKGFKLPDPPNPPQHLSTNFDDILAFLGMSMETFQKGFITREEVYKWATSSKYFDVRYFRHAGPGITKVGAERTMYYDFLRWVSVKSSALQSTHYASRQDWQKKIQDDALIYFNKKAEYEAVREERLTRRRLKQAFSGSLIRDWAEMGEHWMGVKLIMDEVRRRVGGDGGVLAYIDTNGEEKFRRLVIQVRDDLGIKALPKSAVSESSEPFAGTEKKL